MRIPRSWENRSIRYFSTHPPQADSLEEEESSEIVPSQSARIRAVTRKVVHRCNLSFIFVIQEAVIPSQPLPDVLIQTPILYRLGDVLGFNVLHAIQVGNRTRNL